MAYCTRSTVSIIFKTNNSYYTCTQNNNNMYPSANWNDLPTLRGRVNSAHTRVHSILDLVVPLPHFFQPHPQCFFCTLIIKMSSDSASSSKAPQNTLNLDEETSEKQPKQSQVGGLEEDDEFEEFAVQGDFDVWLYFCISLWPIGLYAFKMSCKLSWMCV